LKSRRWVSARWGRRRLGRFPDWFSRSEQEHPGCHVAAVAPKRFRLRSGVWPRRRSRNAFSLFVLLLFPTDAPMTTLRRTLPFRGHRHR
jgi:hypothetical protein